MQTMTETIFQTSPRGHRFHLPSCTQKFLKSSFVNRCLFKFLQLFGR